MLTRTTEIEKRVSVIPPDQQGRAWALFCSNGFDWCLDELEDFAHFYHTGQAREDDWSANLTARYMEDKRIIFRGNLSGSFTSSGRGEKFTLGNFAPVSEGSSFE